MGLLQAERGWNLLLRSNTADPVALEDPLARSFRIGDGMVVKFETFGLLLP